ncbi:MAG: transposase [Desulfobacteraceae bacterium]|nr:transposase [Desulfobacteraceae bacterium]
MQKSRYTEEKIIKILKEVEAGKKVVDICREYGISDATFYKWRSKYGGMDVSDAKRLKQLEDENRRLKKLLADTMLDKQILQDVIEKKF